MRARYNQREVPTRTRRRRHGLGPPLCTVARGSVLVRGRGGADPQPPSQVRLRSPASAAATATGTSSGPFRLTVRTRDSSTRGPSAAPCPPREGARQPGGFSARGGPWPLPAFPKGPHAARRNQEQLRQLCQTPGPKESEIAMETGTRRAQSSCGAVTVGLGDAGAGPAPPNPVCACVSVAVCARSRQRAEPRKGATLPQAAGPALPAFPFCLCQSGRPAPAFRAVGAGLPLPH